MATVCSSAAFEPMDQRSSYGQVRHVLFSVLLFQAASCARPGPLPLNRAALRASQPRTILATLPPYPPFWKSYRKRTFLGFPLLGAAIGEAAAEEEGRKVQSLGVKDPADAIGAVLMGGLVKRFALQVPDVGKTQTRGTSAEELSGEYQHTDLVLDVRTTRWGVSPTSATRYAISMRAP